MLLDWKAYDDYLLGYDEIEFETPKIADHPEKTFYVMNMHWGGRNTQRQMQLLWMIPDDIASRYEKEFRVCTNCVKLEYFIRKHVNIDPVRGINYNTGKRDAKLGRPKSVKF